MNEHPIGRSRRTWREIVAFAVLLTLIYGSAYLSYYHVRGLPSERYHFYPPHQPKSAVLASVLSIDTAAFPLPRVVLTLKSSVCQDPELLRGMVKTAAESQAIIEVKVEKNKCLATK